MNIYFSPKNHNKTPLMEKNLSFHYLNLYRFSPLPPALLPPALGLKNRKNRFHLKKEELKQ